jgi:hypothetical protein
MEHVFNVALPLKGYGRTTAKEKGHLVEFYVPLVLIAKPSHKTDGKNQTLRVSDEFKALPQPGIGCLLFSETHGRKNQTYENASHSPCCAPMLGTFASSGGLATRHDGIGQGQNTKNELQAMDTIMDIFLVDVGASILQAHGNSCS